LSDSYDRMSDPHRVGDADKANILVVDDRPDKHVVFRAILDELGQDLHAAASGEEALRHVLQRDFAVILLDVNMPGMDGLETASLLRTYRRTAKTPIIFVTAYVDDQEMKRGYSLGAVDYISAPVVQEILRSKVKVFVEMRCEVRRRLLVAPRRPGVEPACCVTDASRRNERDARERFPRSRPLRAKAVE